MKYKINKINDFIKENNLTNYNDSEIAKQIGISRQVYNKYKNNKISVYFGEVWDKIVAWATKIEPLLNVNWLMGKENNKYNKYAGKYELSNSSLSTLYIFEKCGFLDYLLRALDSNSFTNLVNDINNYDQEIKNQIKTNGTYNDSFAEYRFTKSINKFLFDFREECKTRYSHLLVKPLIEEDNKKDSTD